MFAYKPEKSNCCIKVWISKDKYYSDIKYEDFVGKFETKFGGKQPKSFTDIAYDRTLKEPAKSAIDSPIGAGGEFLGNLFQFTGQTLPVAALPVGSNQYNIKAGEETFLQRLERGKMPGEILPSGQSGPGKAHTEALRWVINFFGELGIYDVVLPFLLVFTIVFAILEKTKVFGMEEIDGKKYTRKNINAIVAFVVSFCCKQAC